MVIDARVLDVCIGERRPTEHSSVGWTAIDKRPVGGPVIAEPLGLVGDAQADRAHHGGVDQALYAYGQQDAAVWAVDLGREVPPGAFGENLRIADLDVSGARIGEIWQVGGCTVQVTAPRIPCRTFAAFWDVPDLIRRFLDAGRPGAYLRVLTPGPVQAGDLVTVVDRPSHDVTVAEVSRILTRERRDAVRLVGLPGLADRLVDWAVARTTGPIGVTDATDATDATDVTDATGATGVTDVP